MKKNISGFFAFPNEQMLVELIPRALNRIQKDTGFFVRSWTEIPISGRYLIDVICAEIDDADLFCVDLSNLNPNVLFELGYAIARNKKIWAIRDTGRPDYERNFKSLSSLTTIGFCRYENSEDIWRHFLKDRPEKSLDATIFNESIKPHLGVQDYKSLLYLKSTHETDSSKLISEELEAQKLKKNVQIIVDDPRESIYQPIYWYAKQIDKSGVVVCHLLNPHREGALAHNAKCSLIAGLAHGMGKEVRMFVNTTELGPADYRDLMFRYQSLAQLLSYFRTWVSEKMDSLKEANEKVTENKRFKRHEEKFNRLDVGEYIAEQESNENLINYFIKTGEFRDAVNGKVRIISGQKGSGKTACFLMAREEMSHDRRNIVVSMMPAAYEQNMVVSAIDRFAKDRAKGGILESVWKILIYSEIANSLLYGLSGKDHPSLSTAEKNLIHFQESHPWMKDNFPTRLEVWLDQFVSEDDSGDIRLAENLHRKLIPELRNLVFSVFRRNQERVVFLVDNLDKAWDKEENVGHISQFILTLLSTAHRIKLEFSSETKVSFQYVIFLREDVFQTVNAMAKEPDKLGHARIEWSDPELLVQVAERRLLHFVNKGKTTDVIQDPWAFFTPNVNGVDTKDHILSLINPRPRDLLFFLNAATSIALNRRHSLVLDQDILSAEKDYSEFAYKSLKVELLRQFPGFEDFTLSLMGSSSMVTYDEVSRKVVEAGNRSAHDTIIQLIHFGFLLIQVQDNDFRRVKQAEEIKRVWRLAERYGEKVCRPIGFMINRAYWSFLEINLDNRAEPVSA